MWWLVLTQKSADSTPWRPKQRKRRYGISSDYCCTPICLKIVSFVDTFKKLHIARIFDKPTFHQTGPVEYDVYVTAALKSLHKNPL